MFAQTFMLLAIVDQHSRNLTLLVTTCKCPRDGEYGSKVQCGTRAGSASWIMLSFGDERLPPLLEIADVTGKRRQAAIKWWSMSPSILYLISGKQILNLLLIVVRSIWFGRLITNCRYGRLCARIAGCQWWSGGSCRKSYSSHHCHAPRSCFHITCPS